MPPFLIATYYFNSILYEYTFQAIIEIIGINPFVFIPDKILEVIFKDAKKSKGSIPVSGIINKSPNKQTLVKYSGAWRLYINTKMLKDSPKHIGKRISISIEHDAEDRTIPLHIKLSDALHRNKKANKIFGSLTPSLQKEINRYICGLKTKESISRNIKKTIDFLLGKERFVGRPLMKKIE